MNVDAAATPVPANPGVEEVDFNMNEWKLRRVDMVRSRYNVLRLIGSGVYGRVFRVLEHGSDHGPYALKHLRVDPYDVPSAGGAGSTGGACSADEKYALMLKTGFLPVCFEVNIASRLAHMPHPNVCEIIDISYSINKRGIVSSVHLLMEEYPYSLDDMIHIYNPPRLNERNRVEVVHMIAQGLAHLHGMGIMHRDIKPSNLMVSRDMKVKIIDFGLAVDLTMMSAGAPMSTDVYALPFRPPEILLGNAHYDYSADIWALGCIMYLLWFSEFIVPVVTEKDDELERGFACLHMGMRLGAPTDESWPGHKSLPLWPVFGDKFMELSQNVCSLNAIPPIDHVFDGMINYDPAQRMGAVEICRELIEIKSVDRS